MKLHTVFITYNRLELTKRAIASYLETVSVPFTYTIVDNASTDGTHDFLKEYFGNYTILARNMYPGFATNMGWGNAPEDATHLHRADNDHGFLPGWCEEVRRIFLDNRIGQLGLRRKEDEPNGEFNVGGNNVIRREVWDAGVRYDERPWTEMPPGYSEDSFFTPEIERRGWRWTRVKRQCIYELEPAYPETNTEEYYERSWGARRLYGRTP